MPRKKAPDPEELEELDELDNYPYTPPDPNEPDGEEWEPPPREPPAPSLACTLLRAQYTQAMKEAAEAGDYSTGERLLEQFRAECGNMEARGEIGETHRVINSRLMADMWDYQKRQHERQTRQNARKPRKRTETAPGRPESGPGEQIPSEG